MENELTGNGHTPVDSTLNLHAEFEHSPRSAANLLQQFRYRIQNNRTVRGAMSSMGGARDYMRDHSISDIAEEVQAMVRRNPALRWLWRRWPASCWDGPSAIGRVKEVSHAGSCGNRDG